MKKTISDFNEMKQSKDKIVWLTAYNHWQAKVAEESGCEMLLCGDSFGNVELGYDTTIPVNLDEMLNITRAVRRGAPNCHIVGDFNFGSYEISDEQAIDTAIKFCKAGADSIKLENATETILSRIKAISDVGINCVAHLGICPQSNSFVGSYKCQSKTLYSFEDIYNKAIKVEKVGAKALLLEGIPEVCGLQISKTLSIPVFSIGAGKLDGILSIFHDTVGLFSSFRPYFAKNFTIDVLDDFKKQIDEGLNTMTQKEFGRKTRKDGCLALIELALKKYVKDIKSDVFPSKEYCYPITDEQLNELRKSKYWNPKYEE